MPAAKWGTRPARSSNGRAAVFDAFVRDSNKDRTKRLNAEIPASLNARVKSRCALEGRDMTQVVIELLEQRLPVEHHETDLPPSETP